MRAIAGTWLWTGAVEAPPIAAGAVVLDDSGCVIAVGPSADLRQRFAGVVFEQHAAVLMPGLVNAHTHLELSGMRGAVPGGRGFVPWVDKLVSLRAQRAPELDAEAVDNAVSELLASGVVAVGEVCNRLQSVAALADVPILACVFHEVFGMRKDVGEATLGFADAERASYAGFPAHVRYAVAPHTPYTLHPEVLQTIVRRAADSGMRTSLHLAEHAAERAYLSTGQGPYADWIVQRSASPVDWPAPGCDAIRYADRLGLLGPQLLAVHLTDAKPDELAIIAERGCAVVLCPRSNLHIELKLPPLLDILKAGIRPGLGTDSLASNASLDPLAEARALRQRFPTVKPSELLAMATSWGADALGLGHIVGRIQPDLQPGVLAFEHGATAPSDPLRFVLEQERAPRHVLQRASYKPLAALMTRGSR
jgi:cytosine/adenosine deaminase-related metal-dependent hydrolase